MELRFLHILGLNPNRPNEYSTITLRRLAISYLINLKTLSLNIDTSSLSDLEEFVENSIDLTTANLVEQKPFDVDNSDTISLDRWWPKLDTKTPWFLSRDDSFDSTDDPCLISTVETPARSIYSLTIKKESLDSLKFGEWLNDEVILYYFQLFALKNSGEEFRSINKCRNFWVMDSNWYKYLFNSNIGGFQHALNQSFQRDYGMIIIPIHSKDHWTLCVVDFEKEVMIYLNSLTTYDTLNYIQVFKNLKEEFSNIPEGNLTQRQRIIKRRIANYAERVIEDKLPQQNNCIDCGVFMMKFAEALVFDADPRLKELDITHSNVAYFRKRFVHEICGNTFLFEKERNEDGSQNMKLLN